MCVNVTVRAVKIHKESIGKERRRKDRREQFLRLEVRIKEHLCIRQTEEYFKAFRHLLHKRWAETANISRLSSVFHSHLWQAGQIGFDPLKIWRYVKTRVCMRI